MISALFSIKGEYVKKILSGEKLYEYRKNCTSKHIDKIVIYETYPTCKIVGEVTVKEVLCAPPLTLWDKTKDKSGIDKQFFDSYFSGRNKAYAYALENPISYKKAFTLSDINVKVAPQSFIYLLDEQYNTLHN